MILVEIVVRLSLGDCLVRVMLDMRLDRRAIVAVTMSDWKLRGLWLLGSVLCSINYRDGDFGRGIDGQY